MHDGTRTILPRCLLIPLLLIGAAAHAVDWLPIDPEELKMTVVPAAPRAEAIYLYRQIDRDDGGPSELDYERIKILTNEGKSNGNVRIPHDKENERISSVDARTIRPNGSIIEYRYRRQMSVGWVFNSRWILSADLRTKLVRFSLIPADSFWLQWSWPTGLPPGTTASAKEHGRVRLETRDLPALIDEEFAPPDDLLKYRVDFMYGDPGELEWDSDVCWRTFGHSTRTHPLYFTYPYQYNDYVNIKLPKGRSVSALPTSQNEEQGKLAYQFGAELEGDTLSLHRQLSVNAVMIPASSYEGFRSFFQGVKAPDEEQIIIAAAPPAARSH